MLRVRHDTTRVQSTHTKIAEILPHVDTAPDTNGEQHIPTHWAMSSPTHCWSLRFAKTQCGRHAVWVFMLLRNCRFHSVTCLRIISPGVRFATGGGVRCWTTRKMHKQSIHRKLHARKHACPLFFFCPTALFLHVSSMIPASRVCEWRRTSKEPCRAMTTATLHTQA